MKKIFLLPLLLFACHNEPEPIEHDMTVIAIVYANGYKEACERWETDTATYKNYQEDSTKYMNRFFKKR